MYRESEFLCLFPSVFTIEFQCFSVFSLSVIYYLTSVTDSLFFYSCFCFSSFLANGPGRTHLVKRLALDAALIQIPCVEAEPRGALGPVQPVMQRLPVPRVGAHAAQI